MGFEAGDDGTLYYLASDSSFDCTTDRYYGMYAYAATMVLVSLLGQGDHLRMPIPDPDHKVQLQLQLQPYP